MLADPHAHVLAEIDGRLGHIRLNRPKKINALTMDMISRVRSVLTTWVDEASVSAVLIDGAGERGLSAGGDIASMYEGLQGDDFAPQGFWSDEYQMNLQIAQYPKPIIAVMDGITFGGGVGIGGHASLRVVTETSQLAMPETAIGLSPDVGGLYLLSRAPGELGTHCALTGARLGPTDAVTAGLADCFVPREALGDMTKRLASVRSSDDVVSAVRTVIDAPPHSSMWTGNQAWIDACYQGDDAAAILARLRAREESAAQDTAVTLAAMSPTAVAVTLRAIRNAAKLSLADVLAQDLKLSVRFAAHPDFTEGIRAQIIDKDRNPRWQPDSLDAVDPGDVADFFI